MSPRRLRFTLSLLQLATFATLVRSVAFDRWITVAASILLLVAAYAAQRGRTWGVALSFALGVTLAGVCALGIAPLWFGVVGFLAVRPFISLFRDFSRFDRGATAALTVLASGFGVIGAVAWKQFAFDLFRAFPSLLPSAYPHHGPALLAMLAAALLGSRLLRANEEKEAGESTGSAERSARFEATHVRVSTAEARSSEVEEAALAELDSELEGRLEAPRARLRQ